MSRKDESVMTCEYAKPDAGARLQLKIAGDIPFWRTKSLQDMTAGEWEALCDGCGRCCLIKLEDEDTGEIHHTSVACKLLDTENCRCVDYDHRHKRVADCLKLTPENLGDLSWLPPTCAYRVIATGGELAWWHPLVSGTGQTVIDAGISVKGRVDSELDVDEDDLPDFMCTWPVEDPLAK